MEAPLHQKALSFFKKKFRNIIYRQSETNCSLDTRQDDLNRLEHSIPRTFNAVFLISSLLRLVVPQPLSVLNDYCFISSAVSFSKVQSPQTINIKSIQRAFIEQLAARYKVSGEAYGVEGCEDKTDTPCIHLVLGRQIGGVHCKSGCTMKWRRDSDY